MKLIHAFSLVALVTFFATPVEAGGNNNKNKNNQQAAKQAQKAKLEREKEKQARDKVNDEIKDYMVDIDTNKNNQVSKDEFITAASNKDDAEREFTEHDKNKDRSLNKSEIKKMLGLD